MKVREWMIHPAQTVKSRDSIAHARTLLEERRINQLPVVVDEQLVGIITDRDLRDAFPSVLEQGTPPSRRKRRAGSDPERVPVEDVMSANVLSIGPEATVDEAAEQMRAARIGALPVVDGGRLVGIIARSDVLRAYVELYSRMRTILGEKARTDHEPGRRGNPVARKAS